MKPLTSTSDDGLAAKARASVINDPNLRQVYYEELMRSRRERSERQKAEAEQEHDREARLDALYQRLGVPRPRREDSKLLRPLSTVIGMEIANSPTRREMQIALAWHRRKGKPRGPCL